jgi:class 3 adenylate cyclase
LTKITTISGLSVAFLTLTIFFHPQFFNFSQEIVGQSENRAESMFSAVHSLSISLTSYALTNGLDFPFVTLPHFELRVAESRALSGAEMIAFAPLVTTDSRDRWENYAVRSQAWIQEGLNFRGLGDVSPGEISERIYPFSDDMENFDDQEYFAPLWQMGAAPSNATPVMVDLFSHPSFKRVMTEVMEINHTLLSEVVDLQFLIRYSSDAAEDGHPRSYILQPVFRTFEDEAEISGFVVAVLPWESYFADVLPEGAEGVLVEVTDTCGSGFTYLVEGREAEVLDSDDKRNTESSVNPRQESEFAEFARYNGDADDNFIQCEFSFVVFPSKELQESCETKKPALYASISVLVFCVMVIVFAIYDGSVQKRQEKVIANAEHTNALVSSLFPKAVQQRMMGEATKQAEKEKIRRRAGFGTAPKSQLKSFLEDEDHTESPSAGELIHKTKPIADLFPNTTIMFADIVGFTAWSSMREPSQVFTLLETIYHAFDEIAKRRRVFKVETVGDCYVAVAGLPEPRVDHHVVMARFARDCLYKMGTTTKRLEIVLGPDTGDLGLRIGLHSGPVTAGVLRGERARFQLFGDTVNTTARVETTGAPNKIHLSSDTAELLTASGKGHWVQMRSEKVVAKGKGELQTYWLDMKGTSSRSQTSGSVSSDANSRDNLARLERVASQLHVEEASETSSITSKQLRLVDWNADIMKRLLREIVARRDACGSPDDSAVRVKALEYSKLSKDDGVLDEVEEIITLPKFDSKAARNQKDADSFELSETVSTQLHDFVQTISAMYRHNPFHNFEHASHVSMSVLKLLSRIVAPDLNFKDQGNAAKDLHDHTYGITSDPLTQFAVVMSALIHDVDHTGVPNQQLIKENANVAAVYKNKSVAEQNSVDLAWELLMRPEYKELRRTLYTTESDFNRFRQLVVNSVMATDIMDKELSAARKARWYKAFDEGPKQETHDVGTNRKATIVIEHLIQASDVAHTMQHWHIYRKWNARLFDEMYRAFKEGRAETDPAINWYKGEIGFFDFYIIPLAKKLKECGVFGVSSDEYLNYAMKNRKEWGSRGQEIVAEMVESFNNPGNNQKAINYTSVTTPHRPKRQSMKSLLEKLVREAEAEGPQGEAALALHTKPDMFTKMLSPDLALVFEEPAEDEPTAKPEEQVQEVKAEDRSGPAIPIPNEDLMYTTPQCTPKAARKGSATDLMAAVAALDQEMGFSTPVAQTEYTKKPTAKQAQALRMPSPHDTRQKMVLTDHKSKPPKSAPTRRKKVATANVSATSRTAAVEPFFFV